MKLLKNSIVVVLLSFCTIAFAQDRKFTEEQKEQVKEQLEQQFEKLDRSEEQKPTFEEIQLPKISDKTLSVKKALLYSTKSFI